jgi:sugar/nucleoside kinase (ribokinase family)
MSRLVVVAGHICLDIIPKFFGDADFRPGHLVEVGAAEFSTGGCVANVGRALHRLGVPVRLLAKIGSDPFGEVIQGILTQDSPRLAEGITLTESNSTSYSIVLNPPGVDRTFLHMPGENDRFGADDLTANNLAGAGHFHFGYPPLMRRMYESSGEELEEVFRRAKAAGCSTSLDLSFPDPHSPAGRADWRGILTRVLPLVDFFLPSNDELAFMTRIGANETGRLANWIIDHGSSVAIVKCGSSGLVAKTAGEIRLRQVPGLADSRAWADREAAVPCFPADVRGTTGAGDATIAGFLMGITRGFGFTECLQAATAVGATCVEMPDAVSGIRSWEETALRFGLDRHKTDRA